MKFVLQASGNAMAFAIQQESSPFPNKVQAMLGDEMFRLKESNC
jgi:hypothetical protein